MPGREPRLQTPPLEELTAERRRLAAASVGAESLRLVTRSPEAKHAHTKERHAALVKQAAEQIKGEAREVARGLARRGFPPEIAITRESVQKSEGVIRTRAAAPTAWRHGYQKINPVEEVPGWILTISHKIHSPKRNMPVQYKGLALGTDGVIYGFTTRGLDDFTVQNKYSARGHEGLQHDHSLSDHPTLVWPIQIDEHGRYDESPETMDKVYRPEDYVRGVPERDRQFAGLVHGDGVREAFADLILSAQNGAAPVTAPVGPDPELPPSSF